MDASGITASGAKVEGLAGLRALLLENPEQFPRTVTEKLLAYALGRKLEYYDYPAVRRIVRDAAERGSTVVLNSHLLGEVERSCGRVVILDRGRVVASGPPAGLIGAGAVSVRVTGLPDARERLAAFGAATVDGDRLTFTGVTPERVPDLVAAIVDAGGRVHAVEPQRASLEEAFIAILRDAADRRGTLP